MDNAARARRRVLAIFLPVAAVLYISAEALSPKCTDQVATDTATALKLLAIAAKHPTQLYVAGTCAVLGLGALAVSYAAIAALASHNRSRPAYPCSSIQRPPGRARTDARNRGRSVTPGSVSAEERASEVCVLFPAGPAAWYRNPSKYRR